MNNVKFYSSFLILIVLVFPTSCGQNSDTSVKAEISKEYTKENPAIVKNYKVTFIELGSVKCIPCQKMQPVMKSVETKYGNEVKVVFYDVWTEAGAPYAKQFNINVIPTQVFLDKDGKEYSRHVGFFPEDELVKILQMKGVNMN
jgi:thioredoxin 1